MTRLGPTTPNEVANEVWRIVELPSGKFIIEKKENHQSWFGLGREREEWRVLMGGGLMGALTFKTLDDARARLKREIRGEVVHAALIEESTSCEREKAKVVIPILRSSDYVHELPIGKIVDGVIEFAEGHELPRQAFFAMFGNLAVQIEDEVDGKIRKARALWWAMEEE